MNKRNSLYPVYLAGLVDSDFGIGVHINRKQREKFGFMPYVEIDQYFAGLTDGDGSIFVSIHKNRNAKVKYELEPTVKIDTDNRNMQELVNRFFTFCENIGIKGNIFYRGDSIIRLHVGGYKKVRLFLESIYPFLIIKRKEAEIMLKHIIPMLEKGIHHTKAGILEIMPWIEELNKGHKGKNRKYTLEYFQKLFGEAEIE